MRFHFLVFACLAKEMAHKKRKKNPYFKIGIKKWSPFFCFGARSAIFWHLNTGTFSKNALPFCSLQPIKSIQFFDGFLIFLSLPTYGKLRKIKKPSKNCIVWSVEASKVKCQEIYGFDNIAFSLYKHSCTASK